MPSLSNGRLMVLESLWAGNRPLSERLNDDKIGVRVYVYAKEKDKGTQE